MSLPTETFERSIRLLASRKFGTFWFASLLSNIGTWAQQVAQPWLLLNLGATSFLLGLDNFAMGAPVIALTLFGGVLADRADRRSVIATFQSIQMLCPTLIVILLINGSIRPWIIIALSLIVGITDALSMPSFQSIVPTIVTRDQLSAGVALNATQFNLSRILGPAIAALLMTSVGAAGAFGLSALSYIPFILVAIWLLPGAAPPSNGPKRLDRAEIGGSVRRIFHESILRCGLLTVLTTSLLCAPLVTFVPLLIQQDFHGDVAHFGIAVGAFGVGGILGAAGLLGVDEKYDRRPVSSWLAALYGVVVALTALNRWFWMLPILFMLAGVAMTASNSAANALLLAAAPAALRGRTISLYMIAVRGGSALGALVTGASVSLLGVRHALLFNGISAVIAQLALGRAWRRGAALPKQPLA